MNETLASTSLAPTSLRRTLPEGFVRPKEVETHPFDAETLWYDAFWNKGWVYLLCPKLFAIKDAVLSGQFFVDDEPVRRPKFKSYPRYHILYLRSRRVPKTVSVQLEGARLSSQVHAPDHMFDGLNCGVTLSKNNDLKWIEDFANYHAKVHAMQGMVFFDHMSDRYEPAQICEALGRGGIRAARVISIPFPYGFISENADGKRNANSEMLQVSLLNIARLRFFKRARAVLVSDIDEIVWCDAGVGL